MRWSTLIAMLAVGYFAVLASAAVAQQASPLPYANTQVEPDQESSPLGVATEDFKAVHRLSSTVRGVRGTDGVVYWVSPDHRVLTAYRGAQQVWQTPVANAFRSQFKDPKIEQLIFTSNVIFIVVNKKGFIEVDRQSGNVSPATVYFEPGTKQPVSAARPLDQPNQPVTVNRVPTIPPVTRSGHKIYTYVEQMPQLPGGGGLPALVQAVQSKISYPKAVAGEAVPRGRAFITFVVDADGTVQNATIVKGMSTAFDAAVVAAVKELPRFEPGKQAGQPVAVVYTLPVEFKTKP